MWLNPTVRKDRNSSMEKEFSHILRVLCITTIDKNISKLGPPFLVVRPIYNFILDMGFVSLLLKIAVMMV